MDDSQATGLAAKLGQPPPPLGYDLPPPTSAPGQLQRRSKSSPSNSLRRFPGLGTWPSTGNSPRSPGNPAPPDSLKPPPWNSTVDLGNVRPEHEAPDGRACSRQSWHRDKTDMMDTLGLQVSVSQSSFFSGRSFGQPTKSPKRPNTGTAEIKRDVGPQAVKINLSRLRRRCAETKLDIDFFMGPGDPMTSTRLHELKVIHNSAQRQKTKDKKGDVSAAAFLGPAAAAQRRKEASRWEDMSPIEQLQKLSDDLKTEKPKCPRCQKNDWDDKSLGHCALCRGKRADRCRVCGYDLCIDCLLLESDRPSNEANGEREVWKGNDDSALMMLNFKLPFRRESAMEGSQ